MYGYTRFYNELQFLPLQRASRMLPVLALTFLVLGLAITPSVAQAAQAAATSKVHIYLIRGGLNVFSLGMDEIAAKLQRLGIHATVHNHLVWPLLAEEAAAEYKSGRVRTIILVGHSWGAGAVTSMAAHLGVLGVPVKLAIGLDPSSHAAVSGNVGRYINYYISDGIGEAIDRSPQFHGKLENVDVTKLPKMPDIRSIVGHFTLDKNQALQDRVIREIRAAI
jgi:hypothetical protein